MLACELSSEIMNAKGCVPEEWLCVDRAGGSSSASNRSPLQSNLLSHPHGWTSLWNLWCSFIGYFISSFIFVHYFLLFWSRQLILKVHMAMRLEPVDICLCTRACHSHELFCDRIWQWWYVQLCVQPEIRFVWVGWAAGLLRTHNNTRHPGIFLPSHAWFQSHRHECSPCHMHVSKRVGFLVLFAGF